MSEASRIARLERQLQEEQARNDYLERAAQCSQTFGGPSQHASANFGRPDGSVHGVAPLARSKSNIGRGLSSGSFMTDHPTMGPQAVNRQTRTFSHESPSMTRSSSTNTEPANPFPQNAPAASPANTPMRTSVSSQVDPMRRSSSGPLPQRLTSVHEHDELAGVGMDPGAFLATKSDENTYLASTRTNLSPTDIYHWHKLPQCPSMYSGSSALEATSPMTSQDSSFDNINDNWLSSSPMVNSSSSQSMFGDILFWPESQQCADSDQSATNMGQQQGHDHVLLGCGSTFPPQDCAPPTINSTMLFPPVEAPTMERSTSNTSTCSARSTSSNLRLRERREQVILNSQTKLQPRLPKYASGDIPATLSKKPKVPVNKPLYPRRKHPKVHCDQCKDRPEFRGDHELQRHMNAKHKTTVIKFVCRDPASVGLHSHLQPKRPLKGCKNCDKGKLYGAYYNAAAHLRRWHFVPKKSARGKGKGSTEEKRGGSAGGLWPPMDDLKVWFEERIVQCGESQPVTNEGDYIDEDMVEGGEDEHEPEDMLPIDASTDCFGSLNASFSMQVTQDPNELDPVAATFLHPTQEDSSLEMHSFMGYQAPSTMSGSPVDFAFAGDDSPMWGLHSPGAFTPPTFDSMGQGAMGNSFPGMD